MIDRITEQPFCQTRFMCSFRIVKNDFGYYPQIRRNFTWYKISQHVNGFGLYTDLIYPKSFEDCERIIEEYKQWIKKDFKAVVVKNCH